MGRDLRLVSSNTNSVRDPSSGGLKIHGEQIAELSSPGALLAWGVMMVFKRLDRKKPAAEAVLP